MGIALLAATAMYGIAVAQSRPESLVRAWTLIGGGMVAVGSLACLASVLVRFLRWQCLLQALGTTPPLLTSLRIHLAGIALSWTPGKLGETLRSALLRPHGVPIPDSLAAFLADRLSDVIGVAALGLLMAALLSDAAPGFMGLLAIGAALSLVFAAWIRRRGLPARLQAASLAQPLLRWADLWTPPRAVASTLASVVAYGLQALVFASFARAVSPDLSWAFCVSAFAGALFVGAASMVPAGLGAVEATLAYALLSQGVAWSDAVAVVLLSRLTSLWLPCGAGVIALLGFMRRPVPPLPTALS